MIAAPRFWWEERPTAAARLLSPVSFVWSAIAGGRMRRPPRARADVPVLCVGNFTVGGAGKTPTALALARIATRLGARPGFLTRGYGGTVREPLLVDRSEHDAQRVGDEALLLAEAEPVVVSPDRPLGLPLLSEAGVELILMDDGFQNPSLAKDWSLIVVDGATGVGNGLVLPSGPLRAPLDLQLSRADAILLVGGGAPGERVATMAAGAGRPVFRASLQPPAVRDWGTTPYLAFAGIGRPEKFFASLEAAGVPVAIRQAFADHHAYGEAEAAELLRRAEREGLRLITTAKDAARLAGTTGERDRLRRNSEIFAVEMRFEDEPAIASMIRQLLATRSA